MTELLLGKAEPDTGIKFWTYHPHCSYGGNRRHTQSGPCQTPAEVEPGIFFYFSREDVERAAPGIPIAKTSPLEVRLPMCRKHAKGMKVEDLVTEQEISQFFTWFEATQALNSPAGALKPIRYGAFVAWRPFDVNKGYNVRTTQQFVEAHQRAVARGEA